MTKVESKPFIIDNNWYKRFDSARSLSPEKYILANPGDILVAEQLLCYPKAIDKFPNWHQDGMIYNKLALEQSSGEKAARFKSTMLKGNTLWDLTGGLGMDTLAFSTSIKEIHYCEPDEKPYLLARHNHNLHHINNIQYHSWTAEVALEHIKHTDWIYLDPSRRDQNRRKFRLSDCQPNVIELISKITEKCDSFMIKLSPIYDIKQLFLELPMIDQVVVLSVDGEVKEILAISSTDVSKKICAVLLPENLHFEMDYNTFIEKPFQLNSSTPYPKAFLHVADPAIFKSEMISQIAKNENLNAWGQSGYLWSTHNEIQGFKTYEIQDVIDFKPKILKKLLAGKKVNIHKRNFPIEISTVYNSLNASMGDDYHLFLTTESGGKKRVCITRPSKQITRS